MQERETLQSCLLTEATGLRPEDSEFFRLLFSIGTAIKIISRMVARTGLGELYGLRDIAVDEDGRRLEIDECADEIIVRTLGASGHLGLLISEKRDKVLATAVGQLDSRYVVAFDPLDGVNNLESSLPVGTIFAVFNKKLPGRPAAIDDFLQPGRNIVAAGYASYGAKTSLVCSWGSGVRSFTLDAAIGEFVLTGSNLEIPERGRWFSVNEGYSSEWDEATRTFVELLKQPEAAGGHYMGRYIGSLVVDFDRNLREGGIFLYPASNSYPQGKLHLLYECMPLAFLAHQAGGEALDGYSPILDRIPQDIHERCPLIIGGRREIQLYQRHIGQS